VVAGPVVSCLTATKAGRHLATGYDLPSQRGQVMKSVWAMVREVLFLALPTFPRRFQIGNVYWTSSVGPVDSIRDETVHSEVQDFQVESRSFPKRTKKGRREWPFEW
jgi:hypothetical protein